MTVKIIIIHVVQKVVKHWLYWNNNPFFLTLNYIYSKHSVEELQTLAQKLGITSVRR